MTEFDRDEGYFNNGNKSVILLYKLGLSIDFCDQFLH